MSEFISWIELNDKVLFLADADMRRKDKKWPERYTQDKSEKQGHGALRWYYGIKEKDGTDKECTDFSKPSNFPEEIVTAIKDGLLSYGVDFYIAMAVLSGPAWAEYQKVDSVARKEYQKVQGPAKAEYQEVQGPAWAKCKKFDNVALAEYKKVRGIAWAEYEKITCIAWEEYRKVKGAAFCGLVKNKENRNTNWQ